MSNSETLLWNDGSANSDEVLKAEVHTGVTKILGYTCDELTLTCKSGIQTFYYNTQIAVDPTLYQKHQFGNWYTYLSKKTHALPLKTVIENPQFSLESVATEVQPIAVDNAVFMLPAGVKTMKSPY